MTYVTKYSAKCWLVDLLHCWLFCARVNCRYLPCKCTCLPATWRRCLHAIRAYLMTPTGISASFSHMTGKLTFYILSWLWLRLSRDRLTDILNTWTSCQCTFVFHTFCDVSSFNEKTQPRSRGLSSSRPVSLAPRDGKKRDPGNEVGKNASFCEILDDGLHGI